MSFLVLQVSALKQGLMPLSQESLLVGDISYHEYQGIFVNQEERDKLARNLGPINKVRIKIIHCIVLKLFIYIVMCICIYIVQVD